MKVFFLLFCTVFIPFNLQAQVDDLLDFFSNPITPVMKTCQGAYSVYRRRELLKMLRVESKKRRDYICRNPITYINKESGNAFYFITYSYRPYKKGANDKTIKREVFHCDCKSPSRSACYKNNNCKSKMQLLESMVKDSARKRSGENVVYFRRHGGNCGSGRAVSFNQGKSGFFGSEGRCGQTAVTNILFERCQVLTDDLLNTGVCSSNDNFSDLSPGVRPDTLEKGFKSFAKDHNCDGASLKKKSVKNINFLDYLSGHNNLEELLKTQEDNIISSIKEQDKSYLVLIGVRGESLYDLHWVSIRKSHQDNDGSHIFSINDHGGQYLISSMELAKLTLKGSVVLNSVNVEESGLIYLE